jgi:sulfur carrier protein
MEVTINGRLESIAACTIKTLIQEKGLDTKGLVVEHNEQIVKQGQWAAVQLKEGDRLELLNFVGGG